MVSESATDSDRTIARIWIRRIIHRRWNLRLPPSMGKIGRLPIGKRRPFGRGWLESDSANHLGNSKGTGTSKLWFSRLE
ncbi:hypothetical protein AMTR_s00172p00029290 [Amborella trichopoda]|uniref:Uncharacterized protein n=1 Tax=Amborella trichopoda TaxID=13333 RepID=W1PZ60_AMBTC|nr:hypothetical protein AMTR_s00172p00029290 [Amborella trichopoda]